MLRRHAFSPADSSAMKEFEITERYEGKSFLTGNTCAIEETTGGTLLFDDKSCGKYAIPYFVRGSICDNQLVKNRLAQILAARSRRYGKKYLLIKHGGNSFGGYEAIRIDDLLESYPQSPLEKLDRALVNLAWGLDSVGGSAFVETQNAHFLFASDYSAVVSVLEELQALGFVRLKVIAEGLTYESRISTKGWERIQDLQASNRDSKQAFLAMWFDPDMDEYAKAITLTVHRFEGYSCRRIDQKEHNNKICDEIIAEIKLSRFVIGDFTGSRGGGYFEAGFGMGKGVPVIWTVREDHLKDVHFDTNHYNHITYRGAEDLAEKLYNRIRATIL